MSRVRGASTTTVAEPLSLSVAAGTASTSSVAGSAETLLTTARRARIASPMARLTASIGTLKFAVVSDASGTPAPEMAKSVVG